MKTQIKIEEKNKMNKNLKEAKALLEEVRNAYKGGWGEYDSYNRIMEDIQEHININKGIVQ